MPPRHLYIHVPFCGRRCVYCDFSIAVRRVTPVDDYLLALRRELDSIAPSAPWILDTVYLGGGTPSRLGGSGITAVLDLVRERATIADDAEVTIEANPEDVTAENATAWRAAGVNRVSLGVQTFDDRVLEWMHRGHTGADAEHAVRTLRDAGIANVSIDLIFSVPGNLSRSWRDDLEKAIALAPPHLSIYGLTVEPKTPFARWVSAGFVTPGEEEPYAAEFLEADDLLTRAGYAHYEVSNYARPGMASRHNSAYWSGVDYLGVGPSAHSFIDGERRWNVRDYAEWQARAIEGRSTIGGSEKLGADARAIEEIYLGLRTDKGFCAAPADSARIQRWVEEGWGSLAGDVIKLNASGWLRLDALAADLGGTDSGHNYISSHGSSAA